MRKIYFLLAIAGITLLAACKKEQNCKCATGNQITDFYKKINEHDAQAWCDTIQIQMNNGNSPAKDKTYCVLYRKK